MEAAISFETSLPLCLPTHSEICLYTSLFVAGWAGVPTTKFQDSVYKKRQKNNVIGLFSMKGTFLARKIKVFSPLHVASTRKRRKCTQIFGEGLWNWLDEAHCCWLTDRRMITASPSQSWYDVAWRRSGGNCFSRCVLENWMTWGVTEGELSCSVGEVEFFRFNLLCSFRFHRDFISFHKAVHSLKIIVVIFFYSRSSNSLPFDEEMFSSQWLMRDLCRCVCFCFVI